MTWKNRWERNQAIQEAQELVKHLAATKSPVSQSKFQDKHWIRDATLKQKGGSLVIQVKLKIRGVSAYAQVVTVKCSDGHSQIVTMLAKHPASKVLQEDTVQLGQMELRNK